MGQGRGGHGHAVPIVGRELARHQLFVVQKGLVGDETGGQLLPAHFQGEEDHALAGELACVEQDVQGKGRFAHAGPGSQ